MTAPLADLFRRRLRKVSAIDTRDIPSSLAATRRVTGGSEQVAAPPNGVGKSFSPPSPVTLVSPDTPRSNGWPYTAQERWHDRTWRSHSCAVERERLRRDIAAHRAELEHELHSMFGPNWRSENGLTPSQELAAWDRDGDRINRAAEVVAYRRRMVEAA